MSRFLFKDDAKSHSKVFSFDFVTDIFLQMIVHIP